MSSAQLQINATWLRKVKCIVIMVRIISVVDLFSLQKQSMKEL